MVKIGILTFHRSYNYGAFMQCYSLSKRIAEDFQDCKVEVIDYCTKRMYENYPTSLLPFIIGSKSNRNSMLQMMKQIGKCVLTPEYLNWKRKLYKGFDESAKYLPLSEYRIVDNDFRQLFEIIDKEYDILVVGSDAVWEFRTYPFPNAYYPDYNFRKTKLVSYAASSGRMHEKDLTQNNKEYIEETLNRFDYIGIRDTATEKFLGSISSAFLLKHNCDPTALLDLTTMPRNLDRVKRVMKQNGIDIKKPIIGIMGNNEICNMIRRMFGKKYQIVSVYQYTKSADYNFDYLTPFEWARIFSLFRVTVTKFFHGSMLSLKNGTPTIATDYWFQVDENHPTKIGDLYQRLDLKDHYFYMADIKNNVSDLKDRLEFYIHHPDSEKILSTLNKESKTYENFKEALRMIMEQ